MRFSWRILCHPLALLVIAVRLWAAVYILFNPFWGTVWTAVFDLCDSWFLIHRLGWSRRQYQAVDKNLDLFYQAAMLYVGLESSFAALLLGLFIFQIVGHATFLIFHRQDVFVLFPNLFEVTFIWTVVLHQSVNIWLWSLFGVKLLQEILLHIYTPLVLYRRKKTGYPGWLRWLGYWNVKP